MSDLFLNEMDLVGARIWANREMFGEIARADVYLDGPGAPVLRFTDESGRSLVFPGLSNIGMATLIGQEGLGDVEHLTVGLAFILAKPDGALQINRSEVLPFEEICANRIAGMGENAYEILTRKVKELGHGGKFTAINMVASAIAAAADVGVSFEEVRKHILDGYKPAPADAALPDR